MRQQPSPTILGMSPYCRALSVVKHGANWSMNLSTYVEHEHQESEGSCIYLQVSLESEGCYSYLQVLYKSEVSYTFQVQDASLALSNLTPTYRCKMRLWQCTPISRCKIPCFFYETYYSPESNPNSLSPVTTMVGLYPTVES